MTFPSRGWEWMAAGMAAAVILSSGLLLQKDRDLTAARREAREAVAEAVTSERAARMARALGAAAERRADSLTRRVHSAEVSAASARARFSTLANASSDTCAQVVQAARSALAAQDTVVADLWLALEASREVARDYRSSADTAIAALARLRASTTSLERAAGRSQRRSVFRALFPKPGVGIAAGLDTQGRLNALSGVTLGWTF